jgi:hypothetical protein
MLPFEEGFRGAVVRDIDVRMAVRKELATLHAGDADTRIVEEIGIWSGTVRMDMAVINGELCGYELKSDSDTVKRLPLQSEIYGKVFDRVTLVVGERLYKNALAHIPEWWGCQIASTLDGTTSLVSVRKPEKNLGIDPNVLVQMLLKIEALSILECFNLAKGWRSKTARDIGNRLVREIQIDDLAYHVRTALKYRPKLGQVMSRNFDVPIEVQAHPNTRATRRLATRPCDEVNLTVRPAMRQSVSPRPKTDYLVGVPLELLAHGHSSWTFDFNAMVDFKLSGEAVLSVDGGEKIDSGGRAGSDTAIVAKIKPVRQAATGKLLPQDKLLAINRRCAKSKAGKCLRNTTSKHRNAAPVRAQVKGGKGIRHRDAKGRYVRDATG